MSTEEFTRKASKSPFYIDQQQARSILAGMGIELSARQMKRAAEKDAHGQRRLPFFLDPIDGRLKIDRNTLIKIYVDRQVSAENGATFDL